MPQAISYVRFSSGKQAYGSSLERQQKLIADWLKDHPEYELSALQYDDLGRSGWRGEHLDHGFGRLLKAIEEGDIRAGDAILIEAIDRAGRLKPMEMIPLMSKILEAGVTIHTLADRMSYTDVNANDQNLHMLVAYIQQAYRYSQELSRRIKDSYTARRRKAKDGEPIKRRVPVWLTKEGKLNTEIAPYIVQAFEDYAAGLGERRILKRIRGKHPAFEELNGSTIKRWFVNRTAIGYWNETPNVYPPVVSTDLFYRVQERMKAAYKPASSAPTRYLLSGLVKCGECGSNMNVKRHKDRAATLNCSKRARLGEFACQNSKTMPKQVLEHIRINTCLPFVERGLARQQLSSSQKRIVAINGELDEISTNLRKLARSLSGKESIPEFDEVIAELTEKREKLEQEKTLLERTGSPVSLQSTLKLENELLDDDPLKLNSILQTSGYEIRCYRDGKIIVSGEEEYPWEYLGFNRKSGLYSVTNLGNKISIPMLTEAMRPLFEYHKGPGRVDNTEPEDDFPWETFGSTPDTGFFVIDELGVNADVKLTP